MQFVKLVLDILMNDWIGLLFFIFLILGAFVGLKLLSKPRKITEEEFERRAAEEKTMLGAGMDALQGFLNPEESRAKEARMQVKEGRYNKKKREGKANGTDLNGENNESESN